MGDELAIIEKLAKDENFVNKLWSTADDVQLKKILMEQGVSVTQEDVAKFRQFKEYLSQNDGKLPDEVLEGISAGNFITKNWGKIAGLTIAAVGVGTTVWAVRKFAPAINQSIANIQKDVSATLRKANKALDNVDYLTGQLATMQNSIARSAPGRLLNIPPAPPPAFHRAIAGAEAGVIQADKK